MPMPMSRSGCRCRSGCRSRGADGHGHVRHLHPRRSRDQAAAHAGQSGRRLLRPAAPQRTSTSGSPTSSCRRCASCVPARRSASAGCTSSRSPAACPTASTVSRSCCPSATTTRRAGSSTSSRPTSISRRTSALLFSSIADTVTLWTPDEETAYEPRADGTVARGRRDTMTGDATVEHTRVEGVVTGVVDELVARVAATQRRPVGPRPA